MATYCKPRFPGFQETKQTGSILMFASKWTWLVVGVVAGYMLSDRLATIPGVNKLPKL